MARVKEAAAKASKGTKGGARAVMEVVRREVNRSAEHELAVTMHPTTHLPIGALNPAPYNPRKISPEKLQALKNGIRTYGFVEPVVVQKNGLVIIGGHQRIRALKEICVEDETTIPKVPCIVLDISDREAKKLNVALNNVGGENDKQLLGELFVDMHREEKLELIDFENMGFTAADAGAFLPEFAPPSIPPPPPEEPKTPGAGMELRVTCPKCKHEFKPAK